MPTASSLRAPLLLIAAAMAFDAADDSSAERCRHDAFRRVFADATLPPFFFTDAFAFQLIIRRYAA